jgi:hypothetical protein
MMAEGGPNKKPPIALTVGSKVSIRSAGGEETAIVSVGTFRGLVSVGGDNAIAIELDGPPKEEKGRIRLIPVNALMALDVLDAAKAEEEKRTAPGGAEYFR